MYVREQLEAARDKVQEVHNQLEDANETIEILSSKLEDLADEVEAEIRRIIGNLEMANGDDPKHHLEYIGNALQDLTKLVEAI